MARHNRVATIRKWPFRAGLYIESQLRFAICGVRPVTGKTLIRKDRPDIAIERDLIRAGRRYSQQKECDCPYHYPTILCDTNDKGPWLWACPRPPLV